MLADYCHEIIPARDRELLILGVWLVVVDLIHPDRHITLMLGSQKFGYLKRKHFKREQFVSGLQD
jgi:hypothetical protein